MTTEKERRSAYNKMLKKYPDVMNIGQMCEAIGGISTKTGYKLLKGKQINSIKVGREYRVTKIDIVEFLMSNQ